MHIAGDNGRGILVTGVVGGAFSLAVWLLTLGDRFDWTLPRPRQQALEVLAYGALATAWVAVVASASSGLANTAFIHLNNAAYYAAYAIPAVLLLRRRWSSPAARADRPKTGLWATGVVVLLGSMFWGIVFADSPGITAGPLQVLDVAASAAAEELLFRVLLLSSLLAWTKSPMLAVAGSALMFSLIHVFPYHQSTGFHFAASFALALCFAGAMGTFLGVVWLRTRSFVLITIAHALMNIV